MRCKSCGNEMLVYRTEEKNDTLIFHYKCSNPNCAQYEYKRSEDISKEKEDK